MNSHLAAAAFSAGVTGVRPGPLARCTASRRGKVSGFRNGIMLVMDWIIPSIRSAVWRSMVALTLASSKVRLWRFALSAGKRHLQPRASKSMPKTTPCCFTRKAFSGLSRGARGRFVSVARAMQAGTHLLFDALPGVTGTKSLRVRLNHLPSALLRCWSTQRKTSCNRSRKAGEDLFPKASCESTKSRPCGPASRSGP